VKGAAMKLGIDFLKLNLDWDIDQENPDMSFAVKGADILLSFRLDCWRHTRFMPDDRGLIRLKNASHQRHGAPSAADFRKGRCRYHGMGQEWGRFYELIGRDEKLFWPKDWWSTKAQSNFRRHFLFYMPDATFECIADGWMIEPSEKNPLFSRKEGQIPAQEAEKPATTGWQSRMQQAMRRTLGL
jgi:hypothetical protein